MRFIMQPLGINFITKHYFSRRHLGLTLNLLGLALILFIFWQMSTIYQLHRTEGELNQQLLEIKNSVAATTSVKHVVDIKAELAAYQPFAALLKADSWRWTTFLTRVEATIPVGVSLQSLVPDAQGETLMLQGEAQDLSRLQLFIDQLNGADFGHVLLLGHRVSQVTDNQGNKRSALAFSLRLEGRL